MQGINLHIMSIVKIKILTIFLQFQGAPLEFSDVLADLNLIFTAMFTVECVLKISSFGPKVFENLLEGLHYSPCLTC